MSRAISDPEWHAISLRLAKVFPVDGEFNENENMVREWREGRIWHGCSLDPRVSDERALGDAWLCKLYLGGRQRVLMRGSLYACARMFDAAILRFAKFRTAEPSVFNFTKHNAVMDQGDADFVTVTADVETLFRARGEELLDKTQRDENRRFRVMERQHSTRTVSGRIETRLTVIEHHVEHMQSLLASMKQLEAKLALVLTRFGVALPEVTPATAEIFNVAKNNLTPIVPVLSCCQHENSNAKV